MKVLTKLPRYIIDDYVMLNNLHVGYVFYSEVYEDFVYFQYTKESSISGKRSVCFPEFNDKKTKLFLNVGEELKTQFNIIPYIYNGKPTYRLFLYSYRYQGKKSAIKHYLYGNVYKIFTSHIMYNGERFEYDTVYRNDRLLLIRMKVIHADRIEIVPGMYFNTTRIDRRLVLHFDYYHEIEKIKFVNWSKNINMTFERYIPFPVLFFNSV
jgi:hypothetical protein